MNSNRGKIYIVGIGPGWPGHMTPRALAAIGDADVIVGYTTYVELIKGVIGGKPVLATTMTQETKRCSTAIDEAEKGQKVAVISSGDPGVYAMAGLVLELLSRKYGRDTGHNTGADTGITPEYEMPEVEIVPGVPAVCAAASLLGAPLMHDFAAISLSDRLTPWDLIEKRLHAAASSDFVIALYNPRSKGRVTHAEKARNIIAQYRDGKTPTGIVRSAMREDEAVILTTLAGMLDHEIDMQTIVIVGNSTSYRWGNWLITPRGYRLESERGTCADDFGGKKS
ncbi:MAG: precorrin-3B C(17)-methyltransferase [Nitrospirae bacterium]|nr:precorrin-3B C(17)-methyltransferase [Nitrospirota bacterium]